MARHVRGWVEQGPDVLLSNRCRFGTFRVDGPGDIIDDDEDDSHLVETELDEIDIPDAIDEVDENDDMYDYTAPHHADNNTESRWRPSGPRILDAEYSTPYRGSLSALPDPTCQLCGEAFTAADIAQGRVVIAKCQSKTPRVFHRRARGGPGEDDCKGLDYWVNGSAHGKGNTCPIDRKRICTAHERTWRDASYSLLRQYSYTS